MPWICKRLYHGIRQQSELPEKNQSEIVEIIALIMYVKSINLLQNKIGNNNSFGELQCDLHRTRSLPLFAQASIFYLLSEWSAREYKFSVMSYEEQDFDLFLITGLPVPWPHHCLPSLSPILSVSSAWD